jgi:4-hydroxythreonine-4-phosphate dehydrogenase
MTLVGITMGDPAGVGPEIIVKALAGSVALQQGCVVIGDLGSLRHAARICGVTVPIVAQSDRVPLSGASSPSGIRVVQAGAPVTQVRHGTVSAEGGRMAHDCVAKAVDMALRGEIGAICTAPLNKEALQAAGHAFPGHTELLAALTGAGEVSMLLSSPNLKVIHVTTHMGLLDAIERIDPGLVLRTIERGHALMARQGRGRVRIGVCGINPHAGENGLFGRGEERDKIAPAVEAARAQGMDVDGPMPADTLFYLAVRGDYDLVVAMYHDQGHGPVKVLGLEHGVNITVGLPIIRTSVDHGTAFDIAGTGTADERSLLAAIHEAVRLGAPAAEHA